MAGIFDEASAYDDGNYGDVVYIVYWLLPLFVSGMCLFVLSECTKPHYDSSSSFIRLNFIFCEKT